MVICHNLERMCATVMSSSEFRPEMLLNILLCIDSSITKNHPVQNVSGAEAEKPRSKAKQKQKVQICHQEERCPNSHFFTCYMPCTLVSLPVEADNHF